MASELWQRIKEIRKYKGLIQSDVAKACHISRAAVAQWEYEDAARRTRPNLEQLKALAKLSGISIDWLINDNSDLKDLWQYESANKTPPAPVTLDSEFEKDVLNELVKAQQYDAAKGFYQSIVAGRGPDFVLGNVMVEFKTRYTLDGIAQLLLFERALNRPMRKVLIVGQLPNREDVVSAKQTFDVEVLHVSSAKEAADHLQKIIAHTV